MLLRSLPYHLKVRDHFKQQDKTWAFFAAAGTKEEQLAQYKTELLKNTYKFDPIADQHIYQPLEIAKKELALSELPVTVYQAQYTDELNASIIFVNNEAHIVFSGRIISFLNEKELLGVLAHELTHVKLYSMLDGDLEIADRIIHAIANNHHSEASYYETARLYRLYTEIFCDRGAYIATGDINPVISGLVKAATGLEKISAEAYLKQAAEIFAEGETKETNISHPENFVRARALELWHQQGDAAETEITKMIEGMADLDRLDIFQQQELTVFTKNILQLFLKPKWIQTTLILGHAKSFFTDFSLDDKILLTKETIEKTSTFHQSVKDYICYLLLDITMLDPILETIPFGWAYQFTEDLDLKNTFETIVKKELRLTDKKFQQHRDKSLAAFYEVKENESEQIYE